MNMSWIESPESSTIVRFGYDNRSRTLLVQFKGKNDPYEYLNVPQVIFDQMRRSPSKGQFLALTVKGKYQYK